MSLRKEMQESPFGKHLLEAYDLACKKNKDYGTSDNPFANFEKAEEFFGTSASKGVAIRLADKWVRFCKGVRGGKFAIADETQIDTCTDIINYMAIYMSLLEKEKTNDTNRGKEDT